MGNKLFGVDIAGIVNKEISPGLLSATLVKRNAGTRTAGSLTGGTQPSETSKTARGISQPLSSLRADTVVEDATAAILLIGDSIQDLAVPVTGDEINIEGVNYTIVRVDRDPAAATYICQVKS